MYLGIGILFSEEKNGQRVLFFNGCGNPEHLHRKSRVFGMNGKMHLVCVL